MIAGWFRRSARPHGPSCNRAARICDPGRLLIRDDSSLMLSQACTMICSSARPAAAESTNGSIHCCGEFGHLIEPMLEIEPLRGIDFGQSWLNDVASAYAKCSSRGVALTRIVPARDELVSGRAAADYPTGALFVYETSDWPDAASVAGQYGISARS